MPTWSLQFNGNTYTDDNFNGTAYAGTWYNFFRDVAAQLSQSANATSGSDLTVAGSGSLSFAIQQNKPFAVGQPVRLARTSSPTNTYMDGIITAYTPTTGNMTISIVAANGVGSGPYNDWTLSIGGARAAATLPLGTNEGGTGATTVSVARTNLGATAVGAAIFTATDAAAARTTLGATSTGVAVFTSASTTAARSSLGATSTGDALFTAASVSAARGVLGLGTAALLNTEDIERAGVVKLFAGPAGSIPTGYLICDGSAVNRTTYAALFAAIGTTHGSGDGSTTFNLPNLQDVFPIGASGTRPVGSTGGAFTDVSTAAGGHDHGGSVGNTALTLAQIPAHDHFTMANASGSGTPGPSTYFARISNQVSGNNDYTAQASASVPTIAPTSQRGSGSAHNHTISAVSDHTHTVDVVPPYRAMHFIIKT